MENATTTQALRERLKDLSLLPRSVEELVAVATAWDSLPQGQALTATFSGHAASSTKRNAARLLGEALRDKGALKTGQIFELQIPDGVISPYVGGSAQNIRKAFDAAAGGILYIDLEKLKKLNPQSEDSSHSSFNEMVYAEVINKITSLMTGNESLVIFDLPEVNARKALEEVDPAWSRRISFTFEIEPAVLAPRP